MPLMRVTPENLLPTVRGQVESLQEAIEQAGRSPALQSLQEDAARLSDLLGKGTVQVELLALDGLHPQWTGGLSHWLETDPQPIVQAIQEESTVQLESTPDTISTVRVRGRLDPGAQRSGAHAPPVLVIASGSKERPEKEILDQLAKAISSRPLSLLVAPKGSEWCQALAALGNRGHWVCKPLFFEDLVDKRLAESFQRPPWPQAATVAQAWSVTGALASLHQAFSAALESARRSIRAKRATLDQRTAREEGPASPAEIVGEVRSYLQKHFENFQKGVASRLNELTAPHEGTLTRKIESIIQEFNEFHITKKPKNDVLSVPESVQREIFGTIRESLGSACRSDSVALRDLLRDVSEGVEKRVEKRGGPPVAIHIEHLPQQKLETLLERSLQQQRNYSGQLSRKGPMDYFMAARRYQMLFFMVFSAVGLSFIRSYRAFTIPIGILLMAFGMLNVINSAKKDRAEAEEKEFGKARDILRTEATKAMTAIHKGWEQLVTGFIAERQAEIVETVEQTVTSVAEQVNRAVAEDKELAQQQLKSLDSAQRKIDDGIKRSEAATTELKELTAQIVEIFATVTSPAQDSDTPQVPGAAAGSKKPAAGVNVPKSPSLPGDAAAALANLKKSGGKPGGAPAGSADSKSAPAAKQVKPPRAKSEGSAKDAFAKLKQKKASPGQSGGKPKERNVRPSAPRASGSPSGSKDKQQSKGKLEELKARMAKKRKKKRKSAPDERSPNSE